MGGLRGSSFRLINVKRRRERENNKTKRNQETGGKNELVVERKKRMYVDGKRNWRDERSKEKFFRDTMAVARMDRDAYERKWNSPENEMHLVTTGTRSSPAFDFSCLDRKIKVTRGNFSQRERWLSGKPESEFRSQSAGKNNHRTLRNLPIGEL